MSTEDKQIRMTAEDKAIELVNAFIPLTVYGTTETGFEKDLDSAKECADVAIYEILRTLIRDIKDIDVNENILLDLIEYWQEVRTHINNL